MNKQKKLLFSITKKDFDISFFSGTGAGGQHRNRHMNCVRMKHLDSGVCATGQSYREKSFNIEEAFKTLTNDPKFKMWHARKIHELTTGKTIEEIVDESMTPEKLKIEGMKDGRWQELQGDDAGKGYD